MEKLEITKEDFMEALKVVRPSALREFLVEIPNIKWDDIGGLSKLKQQLIEMVEWPIKNAKAFERLGIKSPKGILLYGPPGTGKTLLGKAVATETKSNFIYIKGPEIINKYIGESEKAIKKVFQKARQNSPCILFFDEFDSIAKTRMGGEKGVTFDTIVTQILTEMDGLEDLINVKVIAATNRPSLIDPALLRAGRFDKLVLVGTPDSESRKNILKIHTKQTPIKDKDKTLDELTKLTKNYVGADIENLIREAGLIALRKNIKSKQLTLEDFKEAMKVIKKSVTEELKKFYEDIEVEMKNPKKKEGMVMDSYL